MYCNFTSTIKVGATRRSFTDQYLVRGFHIANVDHFIARKLLPLMFKFCVSLQSSDYGTLLTTFINAILCMKFSFGKQIFTLNETLLTDV